MAEILNKTPPTELLGDKLREQQEATDKVAAEQVTNQKVTNEKEEKDDDDFILGDAFNEEEPETPVEYWKTASEKLGIEAENEDDFIQKAKESRSSSDQDSVSKELRSLLSLDDRSIAEAELKEKGWSAEKIARKLEKLEENGELEFFAEDVRSGVNAALKAHQTNLSKQEQDSQKQADQFRLTVNKNIKEAVSKTNELFGFKVGRTDEEVAKWQKSITSYFEKGGLEKDFQQMLKDAADGKPQSLIEFAQFRQSREGVFKGLVQKGKSQAAKEILSELRNEKTPKDGERKTEREEGGFGDFFKKQ